MAAITLRDKLSLMNRTMVQLSYYVFFVGFFLAFGFYVSLDRTSQYFRDDDPRVTATITEEVFLPGTSNRNGTAGSSAAYEYKYAYQVDGKTYHASVIDSAPRASALLVVQYVPDKPELSRVDGWGSAGLPAWAMLLPAVVLGLALKMVYHAYREMQRDLRLIEGGIVTQAAVVKMPSRAIGLEYTLPNGEKRAFEADAAASNMVPGRRTDIVYLPDDPGAAMRLLAVEEKARALLLLKGRR